MIKENATTLHGWFEQRFSPEYSGGLSNTFLLTGNVGDYVPTKNKDGEARFVTLRRFLAQVLANREVACFWDKSAGFQFADEILGQKPAEGKPSMRERFKKLALPEQVADPNGFAPIQAGPTDPDGLPADPEGVFRAMEKLLASGKPEEKKAGVVIDWVESVVPSGDFTSISVVAVQRWAGLDSPVSATGNPVILIERNGERVAEALKAEGSKVARIHLPRPNRDEHKAFAEHALRETGAKLASDLPLEVLANQLAGCRHVDFEDMCLRSVESSKPVDDSFVWAKKIALIEAQSGGLLRVVRPKHGYEAIGGLEHVKDAMGVQVRKLKQGSRTCDKGWILMGPPGTGKTVTAEALAKESGCNFVLLGDIQSSLVGESERNMTLALDVVLAMSPTIVFVDEAAETIGSGNEYAGDSGVSNRLRGKLQNFIGDDTLRGRVFWLFATNWPNRLPPPMIREGRMDKRIPFFVPDGHGRKKIFEALCRKYGIRVEGIEFSEPVRQTDGDTGAEIEAILLRAKQFAEEDGRENGEVTTEDVTTACGDFIRSRDQKAFDLMTLLAVRYCNSLRMLPPELREMARRGESEAKIAELEPQVDLGRTRKGGGREL